MSFTQPVNPVFKASPSKKLTNYLNNVVINQDGKVIVTYCMTWNDAQLEANRLNKEFGGKVYNYKTNQYE